MFVIMSWFTSTGMGKFVNSILFGLPAIIEGFSNQGRNSDGSSNSAFGAFNRQNWKNAIGDTALGEDYQPGQPLGQQLFGTSLGGFLGALTNRITANHLTGAEQEQNVWNAQQAQLDRDFQERMANTQYQRGVADMRAAGVNPALAMNNGGAAAPSGSTAAGVQPQGQAFNFSDLMQLLMLKSQKELMRKQGDAALKNAEANKESASAANVTATANKDNAETRKFEAETGRMLADNTIRLGDNTIRFTDAQIESISQSIKESESRIDLQEIERACKEFHLQYDKDTAETNKSLLIQQIAYRAVEMSNIQQMSKESMQRVSLMSAEEAGIVWQKDHPGLANAIGIGSGITSVIGNVFKGSVSGVLGRWSKYAGTK